MESNELTIVIVTFKSDKKIKDCLDSIPSEIKIIVIENSDNENFKKDIEMKYQNLNCILTGENKGYAAANNLGLKKVNTKFALILNPDTILDKNAIKNFLARAKVTEEFWLLGPTSDQMVNLDLKKDNLIEVSTLKGFAIFLNLKKFNQNFFDENFFLYFEEIDLCKRVMKEGGKIFLDPKIKISHIGGKSVYDVDKIELEKNRNWHWMWSTFYFHKKYKGFFIALLLVIPKFLSAFVKTIFYLLIFNKNKRDIYYCRLSGILNSIFGNKSWYRIPLD